MWIFTKDGFYSAVQHRDDASVLQVRARVRDDLERLKAVLSDDPESTGSIVELDDADYRFRMDVNRDSFAYYAMKSIDGIDYTTGVKDAISRDEKERKKAHLGVWNAMHELQPQRRVNHVDPRAPEGYADDDEWMEPDDVRERRMAARAAAAERRKSK